MLSIYTLYVAEIHVKPIYMVGKHPTKDACLYTGEGAASPHIFYCLYIAQQLLDVFSPNYMQ